MDRNNICTYTIACITCALGACIHTLRTLHYTTLLQATPDYITFIHTCELQTTIRVFSRLRAADDNKTQETITKNREQKTKARKQEQRTTARTSRKQETRTQSKTQETRTTSEEQRTENKKQKQGNKKQEQLLP